VADLLSDKVEFYETMIKIAFYLHFLKILE